MTEPRAVRRPPTSSVPPAALGEVRARQPKAIHSALTVLEEVARLGAGVTAQEISQSLGLPRATTYRLINLLVQDEYLVRMPDLTGFALGRKVVELASLVAPSPPPQAVRDVIADLRSRIRGGVHLVRYEGDRIIIVDADPDFPLSDESRISRDLAASAMGRLLLAERAGGRGVPVWLRVADRGADAGIRMPRAADPGGRWPACGRPVSVGIGPAYCRAE